MLAPHDTYFAEVEERYESAEDFTVGIEEEFQILDPESLALTQRFEELRDAAPPELDVRGELISSEIEVTTEKCADFATAAARLAEQRRGLFALGHGHGAALGATATHPFSSWRDQHIIDTPHYRLVSEGLQYVAWRNNTWSGHLHVGIRGVDRAVVLCDVMRTYLPHLLALSANSPFIEGVWTRLHSARCQTFVRMFPRCGIPDIFGSWAEHRRFVQQLFDTGCIADFTQIWWSVRPHHTFGTVELRICDVQTELWQALAIASLGYSLLATMARRYDEGRPLPILATRYVEENLWRAIRYGLGGKLVDWQSQREVSAPDAIRALVETAGPEAERLGCLRYLDGVERLLREGNGAQRQSRAHEAGMPIVDVYRETVVRAQADAGVQFGKK
jgi:carboxylate-amine ligase